MGACHFVENGGEQLGVVPGGAQELVILQEMEGNSQELYREVRRSLSFCRKWRNTAQSCTRRFTEACHFVGAGRELQEVVPGGSQKLVILQELEENCKKLYQEVHRRLSFCRSWKRTARSCTGRCDEVMIVSRTYTRDQPIHIVMKNLYK